MERYNPLSFLTLEEDISLGRDVQAMNQMLNGATKNFDSEVIEKGMRAVEKLAASNYQLVCEIARTFHRKRPQSGHIDDVIQEGMDGLMKAIHKYDPERGWKFSTMAVPWITATVTRQTNYSSRLVRLPENRIYQIICINEIDRNLPEGTTEAARLDIIKKELKISNEELQSILDANRLTVSTNMPLGSDGGQKEVGDMIAEKHAADHVAQGTLEKDALSNLMKSLRKLPEVDMNVLRSAFGFTDDNNVRIKATDVRRMHRLTAAQYDQLKIKALRSVKNDLEKQGYAIDDFLMVA